VKTSNLNIPCSNLVLHPPEDVLMVEIWCLDESFIRFYGAFTCAVWKMLEDAGYFA
jgi:hypothetical protein